MKISKRFIFPPRPYESPIPLQDTGTYKRLGWVAQLKYNDLHAMVTVGDEISIVNRNNKAFVKYTLTQSMSDQLRQISDTIGLIDEWSLFDGGLLHAKNKLLSNKLVLWDLLVENGIWSLKTTYQERYDKLAKIAIGTYWLNVNGKEFDFGLKLTNDIIVPKLFTDYQQAWDLVTEINEQDDWDSSGEPLLEGLVLKFPAGVLHPSFKEKNNTSWSVRCRIKTNRHRF